MKEWQTVWPDNDVQGIVLSGYDFGATTYASYLFYRVDLPHLACQWLDALIDRLTVEPVGGSMRGPTLNVALTYQGLKALGVSPTLLDRFPEEFRVGMKQRALLLGDLGESAPDRWDSPLGMLQVHVLVMVHAGDQDARKEQVDWVRTRGKEIGGVGFLFEQQAASLPGKKEHFGFRDGISQPWIEPGDSTAPPNIRYGGKRVFKDGQPDWEPLKLGEFLLGYRDELDRYPYPPRPDGTPDTLFHNGTFLVLRKLRQHVGRFNDAVKQAAGQVFKDATSDDVTRLKALMVGRWPNGCPVVKSPLSDEKAESDANDFTYDDDPKGEKCPVGAHIRRTNPRDLELKDVGHGKREIVVEPASTRHRMIRRGLPYGDPLNGERDDEKDRGLIFVALVADIARQFEFVQRNWINDGTPFRLDAAERDPIVGNDRSGRQPDAKAPRKFSVPAATRLPWALNLPEFVTTRGGEYFFLPSRTALQALAGLGFSSFTLEYNSLERIILDPAKLTVARSKLISDWLIKRPKEMLDELLKRANAQTNPQIFRMPGYRVTGDPVYSLRPIAIVTKYTDVQEVLRNHRAFGVSEYREKMELPPGQPPRGPFILGMEIDDPRYRQEMPILERAIQQSPATRRIDHILDGILDPIFNPAALTGRLDVIQDLAWPVPLGINAEYFGVPGPDRKTFQRWLRDIYRELFLNLRKDPEWTKAAHKAAAEMNLYLDVLIQQTTQQLTQDPQRQPRTVLEVLIKDRGLPNDPTFLRRNMMGLTVGVVETTLKAIARTVDQLLRRPQALQAAQTEAAKVVQAQGAGDAGKVQWAKQTVLQYAFEAMRFNPQNHVLFRVCTTPTTIAAGTPRATVIEKGTLVFAATLPAMFDGEAASALRGDPSLFDPGRHLPEDWAPSNQPARRSPFLFFGYDGHECMGRYLVPIVLREVFWRVLTLKNLRRAHDDSFDPVDVLPEHFLLEFDHQ